VIVESDFFFLFFFSVRYSIESRSETTSVCKYTVRAACVCSGESCPLQGEYNTMRCDAMRCDEPGTGTGTAGFFPDRKKKKIK